MAKKNETNKMNENLETESVTPIQQSIEKKIADDESSGISGEELSVELSKGRTHMSEHRTHMSEVRTGMSQERTDLSIDRTMLSYERTIMSWIRTSMSMITFGFTIYKFFQEHQENPRHILTPRITGMIMILFGLIALVMAQIQHRQAVNKLKKLSDNVGTSLSSVLTIMILIFGLILFLGALFRQ